jgi:hypothetical protein
MEENDRRVHELLRLLVVAPNGSFFEDIQLETFQKGRTHKAKTMHRLLRPLVEVGGILGQVGRNEQAAIIEAYFSAIDNLWPNKWRNRKEFALGKSVGVEVMLLIFNAVYDRLLLNKSGMPSKENFVEVMSPLIELGLDWRVGSNEIVMISNAAGKAKFVREMREKLRSADTLVSGNWSQ